MFLWIRELIFRVKNVTDLSKKFQKEISENIDSVIMLVSIKILEKLIGL